MPTKEEKLKEARDDLRLLLDNYGFEPEERYSAELVLEALDTVIDGAFVGTKRVKVTDLVRFATSVEALLARQSDDLVFDLVGLVYDEEEGLGLEPTAGP